MLTATVGSTKVQVKYVNCTYLLVPVMGKGFKRVNEFRRQNF